VISELGESVFLPLKKSIVPFLWNIWIFRKKARSPEINFWEALLSIY